MSSNDEYEWLLIRAPNGERVYYNLKAVARMRVVRQPHPRVTIEWQGLMPPEVLTGAQAEAAIRYVDYRVARAYDDDDAPPF